MLKKSHYIKPSIKKEKIELSFFFRFNSIIQLATCYVDPNSGETCCGNCSPTYGCQYSCSDTRLKTDVKPITNALDKLTQLRGVSFEWNSKYKNLYNASSRRQLGLMAQDVEKVFPELVGRESNNYRVVEYAKITAVLVEAVKELKKENNVLQKRLSLLEKH
jgi:hypothetical protein